MPGDKTIAFDTRTFAVVLVLVGVVLGIYAPVAQNAFVILDDDQYIYDNGYVRQGLSLDGLRWAFTTFHAANWHPLTWLSHMLDIELFDLDPAGHHLMGLGLHAINAVLLFVALSLLSGAFWRSFLVALLFAVHPLRVESVAWAAERKDLLGGLFWMTTLVLYAVYVRRPRSVRYLSVVGALALGLMAKPTLITLPFVLLLLDLWPLRRFGRAALVEKIPLAGLALASCWVTLLAQKSGGAVSTLEAVPLTLRAANTLTAFSVYLWKTVWPSGLAYFYPHPGLFAETPVWLFPAALGSSALLAVVTYLVLRLRTRPYLAVGWLWYLGTLVPVSGLLQVGSQALADRYAYIPLVGVYVAIVWLLDEVTERSSRVRVWLSVAALLALLALAATSRRQVRTWRSSQSLFERALEVTENNYVAHTSLGTVFNTRDELGPAAEQYEKALALRPDYADAHSALGIVFGKRGDLERAADHFERAVAVCPDHPDAHYNLGLVLQTRGLIDQAAASFAEAIRHRPDFVLAHYSLGVVLVQQTRSAEAAKHFRRVLEIDPEHQAARTALGRIESGTDQ